MFFDATQPGSALYRSTDHERSRFSELRKDIPAISARVLSARLRELRERGVVTRTPLPTSPPSAEYALTALGRELLPALTALVGVALKMQPAARRKRPIRRPA